MLSSDTKLALYLIVSMISCGIAAGSTMSILFLHFDLSMWIAAPVGFIVLIAGCWQTRNGFWKYFDEIEKERARAK